MRPAASSAPVGRGVDAAGQAGDDGRARPRPGRGPARGRGPGPPASRRASPRRPRCARPRPARGARARRGRAAGRRSGAAARGIVRLVPAHDADAQRGGPAQLVLGAAPRLRRCGARRGLVGRGGRRASSGWARTSGERRRGAARSRAARGPSAGQERERQQVEVSSCSRRPPFAGPPKGGLIVRATPRLSRSGRQCAAGVRVRTQRCPVVPDSGPRPPRRRRPQSLCAARPRPDAVAPALLLAGDRQLRSQPRSLRRTLMAVGRCRSSSSCLPASASAHGRLRRGRAQLRHRGRAQGPVERGSLPLRAGGRARPRERGGPERPRRRPRAAGRVRQGARGLREGAQAQAGQPLHPAELRPVPRSR